MLSATEREPRRIPLHPRNGKVLRAQFLQFCEDSFNTGKRIRSNPGRIFGAATGISAIAGPIIMDSVSAHVEPAPKSDYTDGLLSKISIPDISQQIATPNPPAGSREFSLMEKPNSIDLRTAGTSGQLYRYSKDGLAMLTTLAGSTSVFSDLGAQDTSCYVIISEGQINSNINCIIKNSRTGISPDISIKRILNTVTLGLTRHGNSDDSQLLILGAVQETIPVPGSLNEITVNTNNQVFCGLLIAAQSTSSVACAIDLREASGLTPTPDRSRTLTPTALKTSTAAATATSFSTSTATRTATVNPNISPTPTIHPHYTQYKTLLGEGTLVKAGPLVRPQALDSVIQRALDRTACRSDIRNRLRQARVEISIIPEGMHINTLPETSSISSNARGYAAGRLAFIAEENILELANDVYTQNGVDLFDHEFAGHIFDWNGITQAEINKLTSIHSRLSSQSGFPNNWTDIGAWFYPTYIYRDEFAADTSRLFLKDRNQIRAKDQELYDAKLAIHC